MNLFTNPSIPAVYLDHFLDTSLRWFLILVDSSAVLFGKSMVWPVLDNLNMSCSAILTSGFTLYKSLIIGISSVLKVGVTKLVIPFKVVINSEFPTPSSGWETLPGLIEPFPSSLFFDSLGFDLMNQLIGLSFMLCKFVYVLLRNYYS